MDDSQQQCNGNGKTNGNTQENGSNSRVKNKSNNKKHKRNQHHPWDEVSLPGATSNSADQPTILQVISQAQAQTPTPNEQPELQSEPAEVNNTANNSEPQTEKSSAADAEPTAENPTVIEVPPTPEVTTPVVNEKLLQQASVDGAHVLDFESHLIETYNDYPASEDGGVGINELPPKQLELTQGSSKVETDANVRTIIEVEPVGAKTKQPVETLLQQSSAAAEEEKEHELAQNIRNTAKQLVDDIQREVLQTLSKKVDPEEPSTSPTLLEKIDSTLTQHENPTTVKPALKVVDVPKPQNPHEVEERKRFIESLPQIGTEVDTEAQANRLSAACKREYYQSLKKYLIQSSTDKPPVPLQTYRWEDLRRARERGGYPWTHLYKRPLGPNEEPEIVLILRKSQELRFSSESPKSLKKVRIDEQVLVKEAERYIQELSEDEAEEEVPESADDRETTTTHNEDTDPEAEVDEESQSLHSESISCVSDSVLAAGKPRKSNRLAHIRGLIQRRRRGARNKEDAQSLPSTSTPASASTSRVQSIENIAQHTKAAEPKTPRCYPIMKKLRSMADRQKKRLNIKRIALKKDEKIVLGEETKIMRLKNSPKSDRGEIPHFIEKQDSDDVLEIVELDESPSRKRRDTDEAPESERDPATSSSLTHVQPDEIIEIGEVVHQAAKEAEDNAAPPRKAPRLRREHVYEEIDQGDVLPTFELESVHALKQSLAKQDHKTLHEIEVSHKALPLDRMGSSEEEHAANSITVGDHSLAPMCSIESNASEEERTKAQLSPVAEESDTNLLSEEALDEIGDPAVICEVQLKPSIKKEASPAPSDKKVTFSYVEDEAEPHREDIELPDEVKEAAATVNKWKNLSDHDYEPIGAPTVEEKPSLEKVELTSATNQLESQQSMEVDREEMKQAEELQRDLEERYFSSEATTPRTESRTDYEIHTSQVDSSALEELPLKPENRKKSFMASAQDRTRRMQAGFRNQAGKIKTKLRSPMKKPTTPTGSPKAKERKRFKAPEFSKMKMPEIKRPDMSKLKDFKRPEFTKFNKPDMSKFKLPEKFSTLKLRRSKSFKENEPSFDEDLSPESTVTTETQQQHKKMIDFNFGTFPRAFRKKKKPLEPQSSLGTEEPSIIPSTETQPSVESSSSPKGDRGPGPVRSRWADKFSDVSYNDSEGSRYRRYGSEQESFDRESSLERRMKDDLDETASEAAPDLGILSGADDTRQFAEFDEENRAIHEISSQRAGEFKRRPMIHQDSDLRSEDSKDIGWTEKEIQKNKLLRKAELEAEASYLKYPPSEEGYRHDNQSIASSGKKVVLEEIDDDEFFLRKRGISEDNMELRQYISNAIREGYDMPINALQHVGRTSEPMEYGDYDVPPPKPRRLHKSFQPEDASQEFKTHSEYGDDLSTSQNGSDFYPPKRPLRKGRSRSKYSMDSQELAAQDDQLISREQYFDDDEDYLRPPRDQSDLQMERMNNLDFERETADLKSDERPLAPRRRKRRESSLDKDSYVNGFAGRSVSSSFLQPNEDVIVYRTEHQYPVPLATPENYTDGTSAGSRKSRSASRFDEDDQFPPEANDVGGVHEKFVIDMMENDGYAIVRKEQVPKPTPPARRKKFSRSPGERFATLPNMHTKRSSTSPPERPPPPRDYSPLPGASEEQPVPPLRKSALSLDGPQNYEEEDDYEEPGDMRAGSPRNLQTGEIINRMKFRPLPPPPRPPREKRLRGSRASMPPADEEQSFDDRDGGGERIASSSTADSYEPSVEPASDTELRYDEVEAATQTDPLPDDFVCEEFEITPDMKVIEPRCARTLDELLKSDADASGTQPLSEDEQLARGLQRFRDANQRSWSERSRASSQAERSRSLSRPQTPSSAVIIERRVSTPVASAQEAPTLLEASLTVRPIDDLDLEEEELRREGLLTDSSQHSKSDAESQDPAEESEFKLDYAAYSQTASSVELDAALENLRDSQATESEQEVITEEIPEQEQEKEQETTRTLRDPEFFKEEASSLEQEEQVEEEDIDMQAELEKIRQEEQEDVDQLQREIEKLLQGHEEAYARQLQEAEAEYNQEEEIRVLEEKIVEVIRQEAEQQATEAEEEPQPAPQPPPRRKSAANIELPVAPTELAVVESTVEALARTDPPLPTHFTDLEVERLRVHALQAGQIMVGQLHGTEVSADELECKSGSLVVKNLELPAGFIEDIVERVRNTERSQLLSSETQTSQHASNEMLPPPKPPRQRDLEAVRQDSDLPSKQVNLDEETQTDPETQTTGTNPPPLAVFPSIEYLQSLAPLAFYNLERQSNLAEPTQEQPAKRAPRPHHIHQPRKYATSSSEEENAESATELRPRQRTRSPTLETPRVDSPSLSQASRQFVSACNLSLVKVINQLTSNLGGKEASTSETGEVRLRQTSQQLVILFVVVAVALIVFMLSGRNVHTHHWDYFNPPGNEGRPS